MKPRKNTILLMLLALLLVAFAVGFAQTPAQGDQKQKSEACCSMDTCCCNNGSCPMKDGATNADAKHADCCCNGDSCEMKAKDGKNHAEHSCCGGSCDMKKHDGKSHGKDSCCKAKQKEKAKQKAA